jgi:hypothetical protein
MVYFSLRISPHEDRLTYSANVSLEEMILKFALHSSNPKNRNPVVTVAEQQNWRCCYCGVRMFAGVPMEDIFLYSQSIGLWPLMNGQPDLWVLRELANLKASLEHIQGSVTRIPNVQREFVAACRWCNSMRGGFSTRRGRYQHTAESWYRITQKQVEQGVHQNSQYIELQRGQ